MNSYGVLTSLRIKCPWAYYSGWLKMLKNSLPGITAKKNSVVEIGENNNQEATEDFD